MKKMNVRNLAISFMMIIMSVAAVAQNYQPWRETDGTPLDFMTLGDNNHRYVKCSHGNSYDDYNTVSGPTGSGLTASHLLITSQSVDPCRCFKVGNTYQHEQVLPPSWNGHAGEVQDKVIRIGCYGSHTMSQPCVNSQEIEYWFYPPRDSSTLLVYFTFAQENKKGDNIYTGHSASINPRFSIEVLDAQTNQPINNETNTAYYKRCNGTINNQWPYSRFLAVPSGTDSLQNSTCEDPNGTGITTYYWAFPQATPTTFPYERCPRSQTSGYADTDIPEVTWFMYKPIAFDMKRYAENGQAVKLRIRARACEYRAHWAYGMFAAKLMPGYITVDACGDNAVALSVPWGFLEDTYEWHYGRDVDNSQGLLAPNTPEQPGVTGTVYNVLLNPAAGARIYPYYRCEMKSYTGAPFYYEAYIKKYQIDPSFEYEQIVDPDHPCAHVIQLYNTGTVSELVPNDNGIGYDTTLQVPIRNIDWYYKNSAGEYKRIPGSAGQLEPVFNVSNATDLDLTNFNFTTDSIMIKVVLQDSLQKCIDSVEMNIGLDPSYTHVGTSEHSVFACNDQLPYFYNREKYGDAYRWDSPGTKQCHVGNDFGDNSWNGCDSVVNVTLEVMTPKIEIKDMGDFCDTFKTILMVTPASGQVFTQNDIHVLNWNGDESSTSVLYLAEHPGAFSVDAAIGEAGCLTSASYKIAACMPFMNLPNTISPSNHDHINDCFEIPQKSLIQSLEFTVYNRNGAVVFHTTDVNFKWRGAYFSEDYPEVENCNQTYVYTLKMQDYNGKPYPVMKGVILVL